MDAQNPKKILFVITKSNWGGAQRYVFDLATKLSYINATPPEARVATRPPRSNYDISVALGGNGPLAVKLRTGGIRVIGVPALERDISITKDWAAFRSLLKIFRAERPDIVHLNSSKIGLFGGMAARLARIPKIIFTAHGWTFNEDRPLPIKLFFYFTSWLTGLLATDIIVLSDREFNQTKKLPFVVDKARFIKNGVGPFETIPRNEARKILAEKIGQPTEFLQNKIIIGTISELHPNKGLEYIIRAISLLQSHHPLRHSELDEESQKIAFIIVGGGNEESRLHALIHELGLENTIFLAGFIDEAQRLLPAFDIFTLTSLKEGLPYVILEAGTLGLPVVASAVGALPEIFKPDNGILVTPKDILDITEALQELINNPARRAQLGANLKQKIASDFTYTAMLDATQKLYN